MDLMENMLARLASGDTYVSEGYGDGADYTIPSYANEIMESSLPMSTLIRTTEADINSEILTALETFEMESILGSTKVIIEGSGQAGAALIMEGAVKNFFRAIVEKLKKLWTWIKNFFKKLFGKVDEKASEEKIVEATEHIEGRSKAAKNEGSLDKHLDAIREDAKKGIEAAVNFCGDGFVFINYDNGVKILDKVNEVSKKYLGAHSSRIHNILNSISKYSSIDKASDAKKSLDNDKDITAAFKEKDGEKSVKEELIELIFGKKGDADASAPKYTQDAFGINDNSRYRKAETLPTAAEFAKVCIAMEKKTLTRQISSIESSITASVGKMVKLCEDAQRNYDSDSSFDKKVTTTLSKIITSINSASALFCSVTSTVAATVANYASQYASIVNRAMNYKSSSKKGTTEGVDYSFFMESDDIEDVPEDPDEKSDGDDKKEPASEGRTVSNDVLSSFLTGYIG